MKKVVILIIAFFAVLSVQSQIPAFPGAEGFGKFTTGGRGGKIVYVTNLNDSGEGSLRDAIEQKGPRIIMFKVSGTIYLKSRLKISNGDVTIAGQTAPGQGITLAHDNFYVEANNVVIRYIRSRLSNAQGKDDDAFTCIGSSDVIVDHCSFSWSVDEVASCYHNKRFTMQNCIVAESFFNSGHVKGAHGYGGIWGGDSASFHYNLIAHNTSRNPRFQGARWKTEWNELTDFRGNVIYNWAGHSSYGGEPSELDGSPSKVNMVNNYYKPGPTTTAHVILEAYKDDKYSFGYWHIENNFYYGNERFTADNWDGAVTKLTEEYRSDTSFGSMFSDTLYGQELFDYVLSDVGVNIPFQDTVDSRIIMETREGIALLGGSRGANSGIVDNLDDVGGYPYIFTNTAAVDSDNDGIPDEWELANGLNPNDSTDRATIISDDGYNALEVYLNSIVKTDNKFVKHPTNIVASLADSYQIDLEWMNHDESAIVIELERSVSGGAFEKIVDLDPSLSKYIDTDIVDGGVYVYRLIAKTETDSSVYVYSNEQASLDAQGSPNEPLLANYNSASIYFPLEWENGIGTDKCKVYFGDSNPPAFYEETESELVFSPVLDYNKKYYWYVEAINEKGVKASVVKSFYTKVKPKSELLMDLNFDVVGKASDVSGNNIEADFISIAGQHYIWNKDGTKTLNLNADNQHIIIANYGILNVDTSSYTIQFDISKLSDTGNELQYILYRGEAADPAAEMNRYMAVVYNYSTKTLTHSISDGKTTSSVSATVDLTVDDWKTISIIRDNATKELKIYANSELLESASYATLDISTDTDWYVAALPDSSSNMNALFDNLKLYGYALNADMIVSVEDFSAGMAYLSVVPTVVNDEFTLSGDDIIGGKLSICNLSGSIVYNLSSIPANSISLSAELLQLSPGGYYITVTKDKACSHVQLFVK